MDRAIDPFKNIYVRASECGVARNRDYICPSCGAAVHLRKGCKRIPYFAHVSGQANPDCENYYPPFRNGSSQGNSTKGRPYRTLELYLRVLDERNLPYPWYLEVGIPEPDTTAGKLRFPFAWEGERIIPVESIGQGGRRIRVRPQDQPYCIVCEEVPGGNWARRISQPVAGLNADGITIFSYSPMGGRRLADKRPLRWGRAYVLLWGSSSRPDWWPRSDRLAIRLLKDIEPWSGALIQLPGEYDLQVASWVNHWLARNVERPTAELTLVSPLPERRLDDGSLVVLADVEVIIGVVGEEGAQGWSEILVATPNSDKIERCRRGGSTSALYSLGQLQEGRTDVWLDDDLEGGLQLICVSNPLPPLLFRGINLYGKVILDGRKVVVPLHSPDAESLLRQVRHREVELAAIGILDDVLVTIRWRSEDDREWFAWSSSRTEESNEGTNTVEAVTSRLRELLLDPNLSLEIDAGEFGRVVLESIRQPAVGCPVSMSHQWRKRVKWLLSFLPLGHGRVGTSPERIQLPYLEVPLEGIDVQDQQLVKALLIYRAWPLALEPHVRAVLNEWRRSIHQTARQDCFHRNKRREPS